MEGNDEHNSTSEIEITEEMIEAGIGALMRWNPKFDGENDVVIGIYRVMVRAKTLGRKAG